MAELFGTITAALGLISVVKEVAVLGLSIHDAVKEASNDIAALQMHLQALEVVLQQLAPLMRSEDPNIDLDVLQLPLHQLTKDMTLLLKELQKLKSRKRFLPVRWALGGEKRFSKWVVSVERYKTLFTLAITADTRHRVERLHSKSDDVRRTQEEQAERQRQRDEAEEQRQQADKIEKVFRWLGAPAPEANHKSARSTYLLGTGDWSDPILRSGRRGPCAISGSGKTILMSSAINSIQESLQRNPDDVLAYYYFSFSEPVHATPRAMLESLMSQIARQRLNVGDGKPFRCLEALYSIYKLSSDRPDESILLSTLQEIIATVDGWTYIILDALDECVTSTSKQLWDTIHSIHTSFAPNPKFHILLSARPGPQAIETLQNTLEFEFVRLDTKLVDADISTFVDDRLSTSARLRDLDDDVKDMIREKLLSGSQGLFRLVRCQLEHLEEPRVRSHATIRKILSTLPTELNTMYARILSQVDKKDRAEVRRILSWIVAANRPMTINEVSGLLLVDPDISTLQLDKAMFRPLENIIALCGCLVRTQGEGDETVISFGHQSVADYLLQLPSDDGSDDGFLGVSMNQADDEIFLTSWRLLPIIESVYSKEQANGRQALLRLVQAFIDYCVEVWLFHGMRSSGAIHNPSVAPLIYSLLPFLKACPHCNKADTMEDFCQGIDFSGFEGWLTGEILM
ncbi:Vegetative incompatibility protein HET-E-1 [Hypsizygus marmoreus]|uniref:Vegetative incompatibility protein HET-E-1 n=1 Tax=Hypsizygus marmoreus TaxID=39966 RepID=A0A369K1K1_HYPMA|nr:Vegetative incompatibility protein HET-E-1 [Hypsizygus marmoreus]